MRKILIIGLCILLIFSSGCVNNESMSSENEVGKTQAASQQKEIQPIAPLKYQNPEFYNVEELLDWLKTVDAETFQEGRYKNGISMLRQQGEVVIPSFPNLEMPIPRMTVMPDNFYPDGKTVLGFYYSLEEKNVVVFIKQVNEKLLSQAKSKGIVGYLDAQYGTGYVEQPVSKASISLGESEEISLVQGNSLLQVATPIQQEEISYATVIANEDTKYEMKQTYFLSDDFEIKVIQPSSKWEDKYLTGLCLTKVSLEKETESSLVIE